MTAAEEQLRPRKANCAFFRIVGLGGHFVALSSVVESTTCERRVREWANVRRASEISIRHVMQPRMPHSTSRTHDSRTHVDPVRMTSSLFSDGPPLTPPSSSPLCGHPNDTTLALSSLSYVIHQLSTLLLYTAPPPTHSTLSPSPQPSPLTHSFLVVALSNVLHTSLQLVTPSFPPTPLPTLPSPPIPSLSTSTPTLPTHVTSPHSSPSPAHDAAPLSPLTSLPSPHSASILPSSSSPIVAAADSRHTIRVLTAIQTLPLQPSSAPITKLKHCCPAAARGHPSSVSLSAIRHASSSAIPPHTANPFAVLSHHHAPTRSSTRRPRRHSLPSSCPPPPTASPTSELCLQATSPLSKASAQLTHQSHGGVPGGSGYGEGDAATPPATTATVTAATISTRSTATTIDPHPLPSTAQPTPPTDSFDSSAAPPATTAPSSPPLPLLPTHPTHTTHNPTTGSSPSLPLTGTGDGRDAGHSTPPYLGLYILVSHRPTRRRCHLPGHGDSCSHTHRHP